MWGGGTAKPQWLKPPSLRRTLIRPYGPPSPGGRREMPPPLRPAQLLPRQHQLLDLADRLGRVQAPRAGPGAVTERLAAVEIARLRAVVRDRAGASEARRVGIGGVSAGSTGGAPEQ